MEASTALKATFNHYEPLVFDETEETQGTSFLERINPHSLVVLHGFVKLAVDFEVVLRSEAYGA